MKPRLRSHFDWPLFWVTLAIAVVGFVNLYSATYNIVSGGVSALFLSQLEWFAIGSVVAFILLLFDYRLLLSFSYPLYGITVFLLVLVLFFGKEVSGNRNWLMIGPLSMQPSEFAKVTFLLAMARYISLQPVVLQRPKTLIVPACIFIVPFVLCIRRFLFLINRSPIN